MDILNTRFYAMLGTYNLHREASSATKPVATGSTRSVHQEDARPMQASQPSASWSEPSFSGPDPALQLETLVASLRSSSAQAQALRARLLSSEMEKLTLQRVLQAVRAEHKAQLSIAAAAAQASQTSAAMRARTIEELRWYVDHRRVREPFGLDKRV